MLSAAIVCGVSSVDAQADEARYNYLRADLGGAFVGQVKNHQNWSGPKKDKDGMIYGINFGYQFNKNFRSELSIHHMNGMQIKGDGDSKQKFSSTTLLPRVYWDWQLGDNYKAYLNAGAGATFNKADKLYIANVIENDDKTSVEPAFNIGTGLSYKLTQSTAFDLQYNFYHLGKFKTSNIYTSGVADDSLAFKANVHAVTVGFTYHY